MKFPVRIKKIINESQNAYTLVLEDHPALADYQPGQFVNIYGKINGKEISRPYSFSSSQLLNEVPKITIKKVPGGQISNYLYENKKEGDSIEVSEPSGRFTTTYGKTKRQLFMIAGGSGITPIFSILKSVLYAEPSSSVTLLYANRDEGSIIFQSQLNELEMLYGKRLKVIHFLVSIAASKNNGKKRVGRISEKDIKEFQESALHRGEQLEVFVCGPNGLMDSSIASLLKLGVEKNQIKTEYFIASTLLTGSEGSVTGSDFAHIELRNFNGETVRFSTPKDQPILQSAFRKNYKLPHSCQEAMCGTCKVKLIEGEIEMKENYALPDEELENGYVLLCTGLPKSEKIVAAYDG